MPTELEKWEAKIQRPQGWEGCWIWIGSRIIHNHSGTFFVPKINGSQGAHRWGYEHYKGLIPEGMVLMPECSTDYCVNPSHYKIGTKGESSGRRNATAKQQRLDKPEDFQVEDTCVHHWVIESPNGPTSSGTCKNCGDIRDFRNSSESLSWTTDGRGVKQNRGRGRPSTTR